MNRLNPHRDPLRLGGGKTLTKELRQMLKTLKSQLVVAEVPVNVQLVTEEVFQVV